VINCSNCGLVISDNIQENLVDGSSCFTTDAIYDKNRKAGLPNSFARHAMGLSTIIGRPNKDINDRILDAAMLSRMERLRRWDLRINASYSACGATT
jgi:transcription initiation factor TFIIB